MTPKWPVLPRRAGRRERLPDIVSSFSASPSTLTTGHATKRSLGARFRSDFLAAFRIACTKYSAGARSCQCYEKYFEAINLFRDQPGCPRSINRVYRKTIFRNCVLSALRYTWKEKNITSEMHRLLIAKIREERVSLSRLGPAVEREQDRRSGGRKRPLVLCHFCHQRPSYDSVRGKRRSVTNFAPGPRLASPPPPPPSVNCRAVILRSSRK